MFCGFQPEPPSSSVIPFLWISALSSAGVLFPCGFGLSLQVIYSHSNPSRGEHWEFPVHPVWGRELLGLCFHLSGHSQFTSIPLPSILLLLPHLFHPLWKMRESIPWVLCHCLGLIPRLPSKCPHFFFLCSLFISATENRFCCFLFPLRDQNQIFVTLDFCSWCLWTPTGTSHFIPHQLPNYSQFSFFALKGPSLVAYNPFLASKAWANWTWTAHSRWL